METVFALLEKHPSPTETVNIDEEFLRNNPDVVQGNEALVRKAISSFPLGSGGGPDGLKPQHIKDLTAFGTGESGLKIFSNLVSVSNLILRGSVPDTIRPFLFGARLCAFLKPCGGIRPIAVGNTIRRLACKAACKSIFLNKDLGLAPFQLSFVIWYCTILSYVSWDLECV